MTIEIK